MQHLPESSCLMVWIRLVRGKESSWIVALIEDDERLASILARQLLRYEFDARVVDCYGDIVVAIDGLEPHVILLDINLPQFDGFFWCRRLREVTRVPIIFVSARNAGMDQVFALENGGDDYVVKPFDMDVLVAKLRAQIRRNYGDYATEVNTTEHISFGPIQLDVRRMQMTVEGGLVSLTKTETELMRRLIDANGQVVTRDALLSALWDDTEFVDDNTLTVNVTRVRRKLFELGIHDIIRTVRGLGYQLYAP